MFVKNDLSIPILTKIYMYTYMKQLIITSGNGVANESETNAKKSMKKI